MPDRLSGEFPIFQIRVIRIERFKLEVDGGVNQYPLIRCRWPFLIRSSTANLKDISDLERPLSQFVRMVGIESLHPAAEVQDIALGMASETLPDATLKIDRKRWGSPFSLMRGQRAVARSPHTLDVQLYVVMGEDFGESQ